MISEDAEEQKRANLQDSLEETGVLKRGDRLEVGPHDSACKGGRAMYVTKIHPVDDAKNRAVSALKKELQFLRSLEFYSWQGGGRLPDGTSTAEISEKCEALKKSLAALQQEG